MKPMVWLRMVPRVVPLAAALAAAFPASAQSLLELYEAARGHDAAWQSAKALYEANLHRAEQARAGILPQAGLAAGANRTQFDSANPAVDRSFGTQTATVSASQPLYRPGNWATY